MTRYEQGLLDRITRTMQRRAAISGYVREKTDTEHTLHEYGIGGATLPKIS